MLSCCLINLQAAADLSLRDVLQKVKGGGGTVINGGLTNYTPYNGTVVSITI